MPADLLLAELESHQQLLLPHTAMHVGPRNLDVGCGSGVASLVHAARLGLSPTLADVIDIRHAQARALPFRLISAGALPFAAEAFDSSYLQYVLHHLLGPDAIAALLIECARVSGRVVVVEEVMGPKTDIARARDFDREMNAHLHPGVAMPVFGYLSAGAVKAQLSAAGAPVVAHSVVSIGSDENGWLETHVFVGRSAASMIDHRR
jgi:ubiquinone/menaquinone biosynthesis C-methylase UbiE